MIHDLKCIEPHFTHVWQGIKRFEIRRNDRGYAVGDNVLLRQWSPTRGYSGREILATIHYIANFPEGLTPGYVCFGILTHERRDTGEQERRGELDYGNPFEPEETPEQRSRRVGAMIRANADEKRSKPKCGPFAGLCPHCGEPEHN